MGKQHFGTCCGKFVYLCFLPAVAERLKGRSCLWSCDFSFIHHFLGLIWVRYHMGPLNLERRLGRSLRPLEVTLSNSKKNVNSRKRFSATQNISSRTRKTSSPNVSTIVVELLVFPKVNSSARKSLEDQIRLQNSCWSSWISESLSESEWKG